MPFGRHWELLSDLRVTLGIGEPRSGRQTADQVSWPGPFICRLSAVLGIPFGCHFDSLLVSSGMLWVPFGSLWGALGVFWGLRGGARSTNQNRT